ncbi:MAG: glycosyltransferase, partial [Rhodospirillaceae bacterium]|nr:glycosyltransferase [Rhodospirillaceae bacterium]
YRALLAAAGLADPRLVFVSTGRIGGGAPAARNTALAAAEGAFVAPLDADDLFHPERLARLLPLAVAHGAAADNVRVVDDETGAELSTLFAPGENWFALDGVAFLETAVPIMALAQHKVVRPWEAEARLGDDVIFNLQLIDACGPIPMTRAPLHDYRVRKGSVCHGPDSAALADACYRWMRERLAGDGFGLADPELRARFAASLERKIALNAAFEEARRRGQVETFQEFVARRG